MIVTHRATCTHAVLWSFPFPSPCAKALHSLKTSPGKDFVAADAVRAVPGGAWGGLGRIFGKRRSTSADAIEL